MVEGLTHEQRAAHRALSRPVTAVRPVRLAVALVVAGGLTLSAGCAQATGGAGAAAPLATEAPAPAPTAGPAATPVTTPTTAPPQEPASTSLRLGASGPVVTALQQRLSELGFWLGEPDGHFGQLTRQAVLAFQKSEEITRDGVVGPQTQQHLAAASRPAPRNSSGDHIEVDLERQLLLVVRGGRLQWAFNTSTGNGEAYDRPSGGTGVATTPRGDVHDPARDRRRPPGRAGHPVPPEVLPRRDRRARVRQHPRPACVARLRPAHQLGDGPAVVQRGGGDRHPGDGVLTHRPDSLAAGRRARNLSPIVGSASVHHVRVQFTSRPPGAHTAPPWAGQ